MPDFKILPTVNATPVALTSHTHPADGPTTGPALWLDSSRITGLADSAQVATWADASGNGRDMTQVTGGNRPLYKTNALGGRPVVRFDGVDDSLSVAAFGTALAQPNTVLIVAKLNALPAVNQFLLDGTNALFTNGSAWYMTAGSFPNGGTPDTRPHVYAVLFNTTASELWIDGVSVLTGSVGSDTMSAAALGPAFANVDIAEVLVYDQALTTAERQQLQASLAVKYGLPAATSPFAAAAKWMTD